MAKVGAPLMIIETDSDASVEPAEGSDAKATEAAPAAATTTAEAAVDDGAEEAAHGRSLATPAVRRIAQENKVNLSHVKGTGKDGRVMKEDILEYVNNKGKTGAPKAQVKVAAPAAPEPVKEAEKPVAPVTFPPRTAADVTIPVRGMTRLMIQSMKASLTVPHFGYCDEYCFDELHATREALKAVAKEKGIRLSYMPFIIKATSMSLKNYPILNSSLSADQTEIYQYGSHNIGIAMDTGRGLLVPVIKDVQEKSIMDIALDLLKLQELGSINKLTEKELKGATFSLSNIGAIGGTYAKPVIVPPQVAIGAIGKIQTLPRYDAHMNVKPTKLVQFSWSADHRVIDGATMARFSNQLRDHLEKPTSMLFELK
jgi:2-oxoisovalerate dehydrogenase E2 component (dihydrolipoyl transacylase)